MSNSQQMKKGLSVRDLITTGILAALYMVCAMIGEAIFGFFPVLTFLCPLSIALLCGPVYMLILAKVPKLWFDRDAYVQYLVEKGTEQTYMDTMVSTAQNWMLPVMIIGVLICAAISGLVGQKLLKKHFEKAGVV